MKYKYTASSGLCEYAIVAPTKAAIIKTCKAYAKEDYKNYLECCKVIEQEPELTLEDFNMLDSIEPYDANWLAYLLKTGGCTLVHEINSDGSYNRNGIY